MDMINIEEYLSKYLSLIIDKKAMDQLANLSLKLREQRSKCGRILFFGNGASASIAGHAALDFTKQGKLEAHCFHDPSLLTAYANDYGYENTFKEIFFSFAKKDDLIFLVSTSGESKNLLRLNEAARDRGHYTVSFTGRYAENSLKQATTESLWVNSHAYNIVENTHSIWITTLIDCLIGKAEYEVS